MITLHWLYALAGAMFAELRARLPGREGVLFSRRDNAASLKGNRCLTATLQAGWRGRGCGLPFSGFHDGTARPTRNV